MHEININLKDMYSFKSHIFFLLMILCDLIKESV